MSFRRCSCVARRCIMSDGAGQRRTEGLPGGCHRGIRRRGPETTGHLLQGGVRPWHSSLSCPGGLLQPSFSRTAGLLSSAHASADPLGSAEEGMVGLFVYSSRTSSRISRIQDICTGRLLWSVLQADQPCSHDGVNYWRPWLCLG